MPGFHVFGRSLKWELLSEQVHSRLDGREGSPTGAMQVLRFTHYVHIPIVTTPNKICCTTLDIWFTNTLAGPKDQITGHCAHLTSGPFPKSACWVKTPYSSCQIVSVYLGILSSWK